MSHAFSVHGLSCCVSHAKTAEPIEMPFAGQTCMGSGNQVLDGSTHGRHLANTIERSVLGGGAIITVATCCLLKLT